MKVKYIILCMSLWTSWEELVDKKAQFGVEGASKGFTIGRRYFHRFQADKKLLSISTRY